MSLEHRERSPLCKRPNDLRNFIPARSLSAGPKSTMATSMRTVEPQGVEHGTANHRAGTHWLNLHAIKEKVYANSIYVAPAILNSIAKEIGMLRAIHKTPSSSRWRPLFIIMLASKNHKVVLSLENKLKKMYGQQSVRHVFDQSNDVWQSMDVREDVEVQLPVDIMVTNGFIPPKGRNVCSVFCLGLPLGKNEPVFLDQFLHFLEKCGHNSRHKRRSIISHLWVTMQLPYQCAGLKKWYEERGKNMIRPAVEPNFFSFVIDEGFRRKEAVLERSPAKRLKIGPKEKGNVEADDKVAEVETIEKEEGAQDFHDAVEEAKEEKEEVKENDEKAENQLHIREDELMEEDCVQLHTDLEYFSEGDKEVKRDVEKRVNTTGPRIKELKGKAIESEETESDRSLPLPEFFTSVTSVEEFRDMEATRDKVRGELSLNFWAMRKNIFPGQATIDPVVLESFIKEVFEYVKVQRKKANRAERKMMVVLVGTRNRAALYSIGKKLEEEIGEDKVYGAVDLLEDSLPWQDLNVRASVEVPHSVEVFVCNALFPVSSARLVGHVMVLGLPRMPSEPNGTLNQYNKLLCNIPRYVDAMASTSSTDDADGQGGEISTAVWISRHILREVEAVIRFCAGNRESSYNGLESVDVARLLKVGADQYEKEMEEASERRRQRCPSPRGGRGGYEGEGRPKSPRRDQGRRHVFRPRWAGGWRPYDRDCS